MKSQVDFIEQDPFNENLNLYDIGYSIKEVKKPDTGISFELWLDGTKIA